MTTVAVEDAAHKLAQLVDLATHGEQVVITRDRVAVAALVPVEHPKPQTQPTFGSAEGMVWMADDFDAPLDDFAEYTA